MKANVIEGRLVLEAETDEELATIIEFNKLVSNEKKPKRPRLPVCVIDDTLVISPAHRYGLDDSA